MSQDEKQTENRFLGLDLIRTLTCMAIFSHHYNYWIFYNPEDPFRGELAFRIFSAAVRSLTFGGQYILFLTVFLIARSKKVGQKVLMISSFCAFAWLVFCLVDQEENLYFLTWDIHALIALSLSTAYILNRYVHLKVLAGLGALILLLPSLVDFSSSFPSEYVRHIFIGVCGEKDLSDWPIFPWVGFVYLAFAFGVYSKMPDISERLMKPPSKKTHFIVLISLIAWIFIAGPELLSYPAGPMWSCFTMRPLSVPMVLSLIPFLFAVRYSLVENYNRQLRQSAVVKYISQTAVNRYFGLFYVLHYPVITLWDKSVAPAAFGSVGTIVSIVVLWIITTLLCRILYWPYKTFFKTKHEFDT